MKNFGRHFWLVILPFHIIGLIGLYYVWEHIVALMLFWLFIGVIGNGVAAHRYFSHGQFETYTPIKWILGFLATLGGIGPITHWKIQHTLHHARADTDKDPHSPVYHSAFHTMYGWTFIHGDTQYQKEYFKERFVKKLMIRMLRDDFFRFFHHYYYQIIFGFCALLILVDPIYLTLYCLAYCIDFLKLGLINYVCHRYGYRNHDTNDKSTNNVWLGWLGLGFGWHNNHHASPKKLILSERWWELDIEGLIGKALSRKF
jgi:stearoyl-CoA desaturase (delta-9 desaturase)